jgi:FMN phosphatase YigB (HAD superfamily)
MRYDLLFFDADDTLFDFKKSEDITFKTVLEKHNIKGNYKALQQSYNIINTELWAQHALGLVSQNFLKVERFKRFLSINNLIADPYILADDYLHTLPENVFLVEGAMDFLQKLHQKIPMIIITNGIGVTQHKRLHNSGLKPYIDLWLSLKNVDLPNQIKEFLTTLFHY